MNDLLSFYFVRHGETNYNTPQGVIEGDLNARGRMQAQSLRSCIEPLRISCAISSPLQRALKTKEILFEALYTHFITSQAFSEMDKDLWIQVSRLCLDIGLY